MKKYFLAFILSFVFAVSTIGTSFIPQKVNAQSNRPYVILVNGYQDCCVWSPKNGGINMVKVLGELEKYDAEFRLVPWDTFRDGASQRSSTSNDAAFLQEAADFINNQLDPNRPLIMIGHSFGGDSLLSLAPRINRRIQFLGVIDPTAAGGLREPITRREVPDNVDYFFNRWQKNAFNSSNVVPFDSRLVSGSIAKCRAKNCDQQEQNLARREDSSEIRVSCDAHEVSCKGWKTPGCNFGGCWKGSNGTKAKRLTHNEMPGDEYLQSQIKNQIGSVIANFTPPNPSSGSLASYHPSCSGDPQSPACVAAIHRACAARGAGGGMSQEVGNRVFGVACFDTKWYGDISIDDLRSKHPGCNLENSQSPECVAAIHRACAARGAGGGMSQEVGNGVFGVACFDTKWYGDVSIDDLRSKHPGCDNANKSRSSECLAAIHRFCSSSFGAGGGMSQEVGNGVFGVACFDTK